MASELLLDAQLTQLAHDTGRLIKVFDTETTGVGKTDKITQFSGVVLDPTTWEIIDTEDFFINIGEPLPPQIIELTGITDELLVEQGIPVEDAYKRIQAFFEDGIVCGYNVKFDIGKVNYLYSKFDDAFVPAEVIDVYQIVKKYCQKSETTNQKLVTMTNYFLQGENFQFHRAIDDSIATAKVLQKLYEQRILTGDTGKDKTGLLGMPMFQLGNEQDTAQTGKIPITVRPVIESNGTIKPTVTKISRWTKNTSLDRLYIEFSVEGSPSNKIFYDYSDGKFKETDTDMIPKLDMVSLEIQVFDMILESGAWTYSMFKGSAKN